MTSNASSNHNERPLSVHLWLRLIRVVQKIARNAQSALDEADLTGPQFDMLVQVQSSPGMSQKDLAQQLKVTKGNVSQLIEKLEQKQLLKRHRQGRHNHLSLTSNGSRLVEQLLPAHDAFIENQFSTLSSKEQQQLLRLLQKLNKG